MTERFCHKIPKMNSVVYTKNKLIENKFIVYAKTNATTKFECVYYFLRLNLMNSI